MRNPIRLVCLLAGFAVSVLSGTAFSQVLPPTISKSFGAANIALNGTTALTFVLSNPNGSATLNNIGFTDVLPAGLVVSNPNGLTGSCGAGTITATAASSQVSLSGVTGGPGASCTFSVNVTGTTSGAKVNMVTATSTEAGSGTPSIATVTVGQGAAVLPPTITKAFGVGTVALNGTTTLAFTVTNPNAGSTLNNIAFTDTLPAGLVVATPNGLNGSCGAGTITAVAGSGTVSLSGVSGAPNSSCTFSVNVLGTTAGAKNNTVTATSTEGGSSTPATATLNVAAPPTILKQFGTSTLNAGGTTTLAFTVTNPNTTLVLTNVGFTDVFPGGIVISSPSALTGSCGGGAISANAGGNAVSLTGGQLAGGASCSFSVNVTATGSGSITNITSGVSSSQTGTGGTATATLFIGAAPTANIPTLQEWALVLLALLLSASAVYYVRRGKR